MDRRMLLAMVLAILVLLVNSVLFKRGEGPKPTRQTSTESAAPAEPQAPQAAQEPQAPQAMASYGNSTERPSVSNGNLKNTGMAGDTTGVVRIDTKLASIELDPMGGVIRSWKLRRYTNASGLPADLIRDRGRGIPWFALDDNGRLIRTDSTRFRMELVRGVGETVVRFSARDSSGIALVKTFRIPEDRYDCALEIGVSGLGERGSWEIGWLDGLPILERDPRTDQMSIASVAMLGKTYTRTKASSGPLGCARSTTAGEKTETLEGMLRWIGVRNRYFLGALLLKEPRDIKAQTGYNGTTHEASARMVQPVSLNGDGSYEYTLYLGPIIYSSLEKYGIGLERVQDLGPGVLRPFSKLLMKFFEAANHIVPNYGFEILILSILIRLIFYPLTKKSMDSMKRMQLLKPEIDRINERHKNDPEKRNSETLELYRKNKINPLGGCVPVLVQLPVLSGLYYVLANAVQLRKEPFILWIRDLSAPDTVTHVAGFPLNILPLVMAVTMIWQQKMTPTDPRQASLGYIMPIFMTFLFYTTPSGLVLYWTVSNVMTVFQQIWMNRQGGAAPALVGTPGPGPKMAKRGRPR